MHTLSVVGHAGYSGEGNDIVCAGVSAIVYALLGFLHNQPDKEKRLTGRVESGETVIFWQGDDQASSSAFRMAEIGLLQIAQKYPEYVKFDDDTEADFETADSRAV